MVRTLETNYEKAPIGRQDRVMLDYVIKLTKDATRVRPEDHERLRDAGFDDKSILQITLIASWFNYINRVADSLGVGRDAALNQQDGAAARG
jgi:alkylhydroperoxidase family enzyme